MPAVSHDRPSFSGSAQIFKLLLSKHTDSSVWHATPFARTSEMLVYGHTGQYGLNSKSFRT
jgi:hypothetical protein